MIVFKLNIEEFEYAYRVDGPYEPERGLIYDKTRYLLDPYAKAVTGQSGWGKTQPHGQHYKARVVKDDFDWGRNRNPRIPMEDLIIYELHVRGFTRHELLRRGPSGDLRGADGKAGLSGGFGSQRH